MPETIRGNGGTKRTTIGAIVGAVMILTMLTLTAIPASAAQDTWYDLPNYGSSDGEAIVTDWASNNQFWGRVQFNRVGGSYCTYIQAQGVTILGLDGSWFRLTPNRCTSSSSKVAYTWTHDFVASYNGMAFRICADQPYSTDPCASKVTIYR